MVTLFAGYPNPELISADLIRSRLSLTAMSGNPTVMMSRCDARVHVDFDIDQVRIDAEQRGRERPKQGHSMYSGWHPDFFAN